MPKTAEAVQQPKERGHGPVLGLGIGGLVLLVLSLVLDGVLEGVLDGIGGGLDGFLSLPVIAGFLSMLGFTGNDRTRRHRPGGGGRHWCGRGHGGWRRLADLEVQPGARRPDLANPDSGGEHPQLLWDLHPGYVLRSQDRVVIAATRQGLAELLRTAPSHRPTQR